jgi:myo-inositol-1(or 4)-monophosphatase
MKGDMLEIAVQAAKSAGEYLQTASNDIIRVLAEPKRDIKLEADFKSEKIILSYLAHHSDFPILSEESGSTNVQHPDSDNRYCWIVDPLDGSFNFSRGSDMCCVSIGLWESNKPLMGVIYNFRHDNLYTGIVGEGAWLNGKLISVNKNISLEKAVYSTGLPVSSDFSQNALEKFGAELGQYGKIRMIGSAALSLAYVACGIFDIYQERNIKIWDVAAGLAIVKAAGGEISFSGYPESNIIHAYGSAQLVQIDY